MTDTSVAKAWEPQLVAPAAELNDFDDEEWRDGWWVNGPDYVDDGERYYLDEPTARLFARARETAVEREVYAAQVDALVLASQCWRGNLELIREVLEITVPREVVGPLYAEVIARLEAVQSHIDTTVTGVTAATSPLGLAARGFEPEAGAEGSRSAGDVASAPAPSESQHLERDAVVAAAPRDSRPRPQRLYEGLVGALDGGA